MFDRVLNAPLRGHSKATSLRRRGGRFTNKVSKHDTRSTDAAKKMMSLTQNFSVRMFLATQFSFL